MSTMPPEPIDTAAVPPADAGAAQVDAPAAGAAPTGPENPGATTTSSPPAPTAPAPTAAAPTVTPAAQFGGAVTTQTSAPPGTGDVGYVSAKPLLATGDHGPIVAELALLLDRAGYPNKVSSGEAAPVLDDELMRLVRAFQDDNAIDPAAMQGEAAPLVRRNHEGIVEAATWRALYGAGDVADVHDHEARDELVVDVRYPRGSFA